MYPGVRVLGEEQSERHVDRGAAPGEVKERRLASRGIEDGQHRGVGLAELGDLLVLRDEFRGAEHLPEGRLT